MKVWHVSFSGMWIGGDLVVAADTNHKALNAARRQIKLMGFEQKNADLNLDDVHELDVTKPCVHVLSNGDY